MLIYLYLFGNSYEDDLYLYIPVMHALSPPTVVEVSWIISEPIEVMEGEGVRLELFAKAFGQYASPIKIGVVCAHVNTTGVPSGADTISSSDTLEHAIIYNSTPCLFAAFPDRDFLVLSESILEFTDVGTLRSNFSNNVTLLIIDDEFLNRTRVSPLSVLFKEVLWIEFVVLYQIE